jgi:mxaL protein
VKVPRRLAGLFDAQSRAIWAALALLLLALVTPGAPLPRSTYNYIVVFDVTQSMNVKDYELDGVPVSRLAYAREAVRRALKDLPCGSRIGWGAFAEYRTILLLAPVEVCGNYDDLLASLDNLDGQIRWSNASEVTKGLYWALRAAKEVDSHPDVIFVTDGHEAPPLDPRYPVPFFDDLRRGQIHGWLLGAGGEAPRPIPKVNAEGAAIGYWRAYEVIQTKGGREHLSALHEAHLQTLAQQVGFEYARLTGLTSIDAAMRDPRFARRTSAPVDLSWLPALAALLLLAIRFRPDARRSIPKKAYGE